ncbi:MAG: hypothetical protein ACKVP3_11270 [Hyphomicrobiaceae bacterium]
MAEISYVNPSQARNDPASEFNNPQEIVESKGLTRGQKLEALKRWLFDVERRLASASEGMAQPSYSTADVKLVEEIKAAQEWLAGEPQSAA